MPKMIELHLDTAILRETGAPPVIDVNARMVQTFRQEKNNTILHLQGYPNPINVKETRQEILALIDAHSAICLSAETIHPDVVIDLDNTPA